MPLLNGNDLGNQIVPGSLQTDGDARCVCDLGSRSEPTAALHLFVFSLSGMVMSRHLL